VKKRNYSVVNNLQETGRKVCGLP